MTHGVAPTAAQLVASTINTDAFELPETMVNDLKALGLDMEQVADIAWDALANQLPSQRFEWVESKLVDQFQEALDETELVSRLCDYIDLFDDAKATDPNTEGE